LHALQVLRVEQLVVVHGNDDVVPKPVTDAYTRTFADVYVAEGFPHSIHSMPQEQIAAYQKKIADWLIARF
jgi:hypothetical protein